MAIQEAVEKPYRIWYRYFYKVPPNDPLYLDLEDWEIEKEFEIVNAYMESISDPDDTNRINEEYEGQSEDEIEDEMAGWGSVEDAPEQQDHVISIEDEIEKRKQK